MTLVEEYLLKELENRESIVDKMCREIKERKMRAKVISALMDAKDRGLLRKLGFMDHAGGLTARGRDYAANLLAVEPEPMCVEIRCPDCQGMRKVRIQPIGFKHWRIVTCYRCGGRATVWGTKTLEEML